MGFLSSLFGSSKSKPATSTNIVQQKLAPEIAPFAKEVLTDAQATNGVSSLCNRCSW